MLQFFAFFGIFDICHAACNFCSSFNIENHYGSFFDNPREVQNGFGKYVDCSRNQKIEIQKCEGMCFSLNVSTTLEEDSDFGISYGCSTGLLPEDLDFSSKTGCATRQILLRTSPPYLIHATYCTCTSNLCNTIRRIVPRPKKPAIFPIFVNFSEPNMYFYPFFVVMIKVLM